MLKSISSQFLLSDHLSSTDPCSAPHQQDCQRKPGCVLRGLGVPAVRHGHPTEGDQRCVWGPQRCVSQAVQSCYQFVGWLLGLQTTYFSCPRYKRPLCMYDICIYHSTYHNIVIWISWVLWMHQFQVFPGAQHFLFMPIGRVAIMVLKGLFPRGQIVIFSSR